MDVGRAANVRHQLIEPDGFDEVRGFLALCVQTWQAAFNAGTVMVCDESMLMWVGTGDVHLTYIPRKPTPLGIMLKTCCDGNTGILLNAELVEPAKTHDDEEWV